MAGIRDSGVPLSEVADLAAYLPPESAVARATAEHWPHTWELEVLRVVDLRLQQLLRQNAGGKGKTEPIEFPWERTRRIAESRARSWEMDAHQLLAGDGVIVGDVVSIDEMRRRLGWDK